ncbi:MAG: hypothetical protein WA982_11680 [Rubrobacteraceae bacterium]
MATFENIRINQLSEEGTAWFRDLLAVIETLDAGAYSARMTDDVELAINGEVTMRGRESVRNGLAASWEALAGLAHDEANIYGTDRNFVHETVVRTEARDGREDVSASTIWIDRDDEGRLSAAHIYQGVEEAL